MDLGSPQSQQLFSNLQTINFELARSLQLLALYNPRIRRTYALTSTTTADIAVSC